ncbi:isochorismatase family cysteine hydrolase [Acidocella aminolytica]|jgi:ureidoacrylate peracid hydrolase|uniref:Isochorismatase n=1 Tax=Acidocella aminolytica 101 = DSM 11237 TaxID=1120923 RepID=A0A0D6PI79_9PROT|nr:isochorismatase family cysteine hydrolase [Acidocella aminolytica]GAN81362.1 isochorismatase [Acidocella aminolytica 101 = DSM 11237]GBQ33590.1 isochorismatase [Acidocella aminolytica 101 = DSM 11237]SHF43006.1 ureidoacrylate peracid hydrolase [Acidocella aminolytica 101 = DSM 11237]
MKDFGLSRNVPVVPAQTALLVIDVQNYTMETGGEYAGMDPAEKEATYGFFFREMRQRAIPNMQKLLSACRGKGIETVYTVMAALTRDGRDLSLDYKITGFFCHKDDWDAQVMDEVAPVGDEIVLPKGSSSVFISTHIHYLLRNMGTTQLIIVGALTDQCVDSAVRDACDLGYLVTLPVDACATQSQARHDSALANNKGYCRQVTTADLLVEIAAAG